MQSLFGNITELTKSFIKQAVQPGDFVIDGTAGNGYDTLFLSKLVGEDGKVFSFDIQKQAIDNTKNRLITEGVIHRVELIQSSHKNIEQYVKVKIKAAMFNLGYLPGGEHSITTRGDSTITALNQVLKLLLPGGIISICIYYGHPEGKRELEDVLAFVQSLDYKIYNVVKIDYFNKINNPPKLVLIEKK